MRKIDLQLFTGSSVTVYKDAHMTTASASPASSLEEGDTVTLTATPASGYEIDDIEYGAGVTVRINVPVLNEENFCAFVTDTSNGKSEAVKIGTTEAPTGKISIDMEDDEEE